MKVQIDTTAKTIKVEENVSLVEFMETMKKLFPNGEWKDYNWEAGGVSYTTFPYNPVVPYTSPTDITVPWTVSSTGTLTN